MDKYNTILKEYLDIVSLEDKSLYEELANMAIILGYVPTRDKTKGISISFRNNKTKFTIMKMTICALYMITAFQGFRIS